MGAECAYWDETKKVPSTKGCRLVSVRGSDGLVSCACSRLNDFMGFLRTGLDVLLGSNYAVILAVTDLTP